MQAHAWDITPAEAIVIQNRFRASVTLSPLAGPVRHVAGADVSLNLYSRTVHAGMVVLTYPELNPVDEAIVTDVTRFPYVPGLLSFREIPSLLKAWALLTRKPDVLLVDGAGIAHPRRLGIASHLGLLLDVPTIGCAKSLLTGVPGDLGRTVGSEAPLRDRVTGEVIGVVLRTRERANPLYISAGHKITLPEAVALVRSCGRGYRLPEPTRRAHERTNDIRRAADRPPELGLL